MRKYVSVIGTVGVPAKYGGFETLVENLLSIDSEDLRYLVYCSSHKYVKKDAAYKGAKLVYVPLNANGIQSILYDMVCILHSLVFTKNDLLILGVSGAIVIPIVRLFSKRKVVVNIDGIEWRREKWGVLAKLFLKFSEYTAVKLSDVVISDNIAIKEYVKEQYNIESEVIAYGGDHALGNGANSSLSDYALSICRIEPENNIHVILEAFKESGCKLVVVGNWESSKYGLSLKNSYFSCKNIRLMSPEYDLDKLCELRASCRFYVHGHSAGGTNPSLVEIMCFSKPVLAWDCVYNRATLDGKGWYFSSVEGLKNILMIKPWESDEGMGKSIGNVAFKNYRWSVIRDKYESIFR